MASFALELALGNQLQPVFFDVDGATWDFHQDYYSNPDYRSNLLIGHVSVADRDFGSARIEGMLMQHLKIRTKDLAQ